MIILIAPKVGMIFLITTIKIHRFLHNVIIFSIILTTINSLLAQYNLKWKILLFSHVNGQLSCGENINKIPEDHYNLTDCNLTVAEVPVAGS